MKKLLCCILILCLILSVFGCSAQSTTSQNETSSVDEVAPTTEASTDENEAGSEQFSIGISVPVLTNPYWQTWTDWAIKACEQLGIEYTVVDGNNDDTTQLSQVESLVASGIDAMLLVPGSTATGEALIQLCEDADVPVLCSGRSPGFNPPDWNGDNYIGIILLDHVERGYRVAKGLYDNGARTFVALGGPNGASNAEDRQKGLYQFVEEHDDVTLLQELRDCEVREHGVTNTENFLSTYPGPGFDAIWCYNDDVAMGAVETLTNYGYNGKVQVGGVDLNTDAIEAIIAGDMAYSNAANAYSIPMLSIVLIYDYLNGIPLEDPVVVAEFTEVTHSNAQEYYDEYIVNTPEIDCAYYCRSLNPDATWETTLSLK